MSIDHRALAPVDARRLEEYSLNASGAFQSLVYDGWLLGYRPGPTKRLRCVNPFYASSLPLPEKIACCTAFYQAPAGYINITMPQTRTRVTFGCLSAIGATCDGCFWASRTRNNAHSQVC